MKINRTYFKGDLFTPMMKASVTDSSNLNELDLFIEEYSAQCYLKCFGYILLSEINLNLTDGAVKEAADQKWKDLINGEIVTLADGSKRNWKGLTYKLNVNDENNSYGLAANYVYFFFERSQYVTKSTTGDQKPNAANSNHVNPGYKASIAWNKFVDEVVGVNSINNNVIKSDFGFGIDWYSNRRDFSLYEYIKYKNSLDANTYKDFQPTYFSKINEFGI